jgi:hypothetical protein
LLIVVLFGFLKNKSVKLYAIPFIFSTTLFKADNQESYILIIEYSSVATVAEWLDGSFESQSRLEKPNSGWVPESPKICITRV